MSRKRTIDNPMEHVTPEELERRGIASRMYGLEEERRGGAFMRNSRVEFIIVLTVAIAFWLLVGWLIGRML